MLLENVIPDLLMFAGRHFCVEQNCIHFGILASVVGFW
jgi:hypothetical protein